MVNSLINDINHATEETEDLYYTAPCHIAHVGTQGKRRNISRVYEN